MKKVIAFLLTLTLLFALAACGAPAATQTTAPAAQTDAPEAGTEAAGETAAADQLHFVYVSPLLSHPIWLIAKEGFETACEELGIQGDWVGPQGISAEEMAQLVDTAVAQGADAIISQSICPATPLENAINEGIKVLMVDGDLTALEGRLAFLGKDLTKQAELMYEEVAKVIPADEKIVMSIQCADLNAQFYVDQNAAVEEAFSKHPGGFELVNTTLSKSDNIGVAGLGVVDDVLLQHFNFRHALLGGLHLSGKGVVLRCDSGSPFFQNASVQQIVFLQIDQRLGKLFQIEVLCPSCVTGTLAFLQLRLNIDQQTAAYVCGGIYGPLLFRGMHFGSCNDSAKIIRGVACAQGVHADEALLSFPQQRGNLAALDLIPGALQQFQQILKALGLLCQSFINRIADTLPVGGLLLIAQPLIIRLAFALWILHDGVPILNADRIVETANRFGAAPEVAELAVLIESGGVPYHMIVNMGFVDMRTDDVSVIAFCEPPCQLTA